jgi:hypothetical protein
MKLFEEFKLYENMWDDTKIGGRTYIIFNYYKENNLDEFYLHAVYNSKSDAVKRLIEEADYRIQEVCGLDNTLVCYLLDPNEYGCTADELKQAADSKYSGGVDLHFEHRDVVYTLSGIVSDKSETPKYKLSIADIAIEFYEDYLIKNAAILGLDVDDLYLYGELNTEVVNTIAKDKDFKSFCIAKLTSDLNSAL